VLLAALRGAAVGHVAAHGAVRGDAPLFSTLASGGGGVRWHELAVIHPAPVVLVLAACDVGEVPVGSAGVPVGGPTALLVAGMAGVVASVALVHDGAAPGLLSGLHRHLAAGRRPSEALAAVGANPLVPLVAFGA
jgi:hypothetical protein